MTAVIKPSRLRGTVAAPSSKSDIQRIAICSMLSDRPTKIIHNSSADDVKAVFACLRSLGADVCDAPDGTTVIPGKCPDSVSLFCGESGAVSRFLTPVAAALCGDVTVDGMPGLRKRPFTELISVIGRHGVTADSDTLPFRLSGRLTPGEYRIRGDISSQYISGLLMALPTLGGPSAIVAEGEITSAGYIEMTMSTMRKFGVYTEKNGNVFSVNPSEYISPEMTVSEGDWSGAAYILACGGDVSVSGLDPASLQRDRRIADILSSVRRLSGDLLTVDVSDIPDLVPAIAASAASCGGTVRMINAGRLRIKESDRLETTRSTLGAMGADISADSDSMTVRGVPSLHGAVIESHGDHRIVMAAAAACASVTERGAFDGELIITGAEAINKSYPDFFEHYKALGGNVRYEL